MSKDDQNQPFDDFVRDTLDNELDDLTGIVDQQKIIKKYVLRNRRFKKINKVHNLGENHRNSGEIIINDSEPVNVDYPIAAISPPNISRANIDLNQRSNS